MNKGLIIRKEWLDKIFDRGKTYEMRSTKTKIRGRIGLIEAGTGMIVGEAVLTGCGEPLSGFDAHGLNHLHQVDDLSLLKKWKYPWILDGAYRYDEPIPYNHPKGAVIWVNLD